VGHGHREEDRIRGYGKVGLVMKIKALEVVEISSDKVVDTIEIKPPREDVERTMMGLLRNMNTEAFFVREVEAV